MYQGAGAGRRHEGTPTFLFWTSSTQQAHIIMT